MFTQSYHPRKYSIKYSDNIRHARAIGWRINCTDNIRPTPTRKSVKNYIDNIRPPKVGK